MLGDFDRNSNILDEYIWMDNLPIGVLSGATPTLAYIEPDHLGTPRAVIDASSNTSMWTWPLIDDPFGEKPPLATTFLLNLRLPGQVFDAESGLGNNYFRDYDAATGRYVESDPIGLSAGISTFSYVIGNPLKWDDPRGLDDASTIQCDGNGGYEIVNNNKKCDSACTKAHEQSHVDDWKVRYGENSCRGKPRGYLPQGGPGYAEFNKRTECKAYKKGKRCRENLIGKCQCVEDAKWAIEMSDNPHIQENCTAGGR